jgi:hypothetical protein
MMRNTRLTTLHVAEPAYAIARSHSGGVTAAPPAEQRLGPWVIAGQPDSPHERGQNSAKLARCLDLMCEAQFDARHE